MKTSALVCSLFFHPICIEKPMVLLCKGLLAAPAPTISADSFSSQLSSDKGVTFHRFTIIINLITVSVKIISVNLLTGFLVLAKKLAQTLAQSL